MADWFAGQDGQDFATAAIWVVAGLVILGIVLLAVRFIRGLNSGTFVAGGRNRKTRLSVMDAAAVDSHRRLVLVRRDNVEHLLLIGGPTDVVVERDIRLTNGRKTQSVFDEDDFDAEALGLPAQTVQNHQPPRQRAPEPIQRVPAPMRPAAPQPSAQVERPEPQAAPVRPQPTAPQPARAPGARQTGVRPPGRETVAAPRTQPARMPPASPLSRTSAGTNPYSSSKQNNLDDALLRELEVTFEAPPPKSTPKPVEMTLDDEMTKLLGELSNNHKR
jgi:hypothetical protein